MELVVYHGSVTVNLIGEGYYVVQVIFALPPCLFTFFPMKWKCSWTEICLFVKFVSVNESVRKIQNFPKHTSLNGLE